MSGLHHITLISADAQANYDFYTDLLGLRLVKRTGNYEDPDVLHLTYGDGLGAIGTLITCFVWPGASSARRGAGQVADLTLAIPEGSISYWLDRLLDRGAAFAGPTRERGVTSLSVSDPDGIPIRLVGARDLPMVSAWAGATIPAEHAIRGLYGVTLWSEDVRATSEILTTFLSLTPAGEPDGMRRFAAGPSPRGYVDVRDARGFWPGVDGAGTIHHVAFRSPSIEAAEALRARLTAAGIDATGIKDRRYFSSLYFREPGGVLFEVATDQPGLTIDEPPEALGTRFSLPPFLEPRRARIEARMPDFALRGERHRPRLDLGWTHRYIEPTAGAGGRTLLLLHGTGGDETSLLPLGLQVAPHANLLSVRGRSTEEGIVRFFRRFSELELDQAHLREEADALATFVRNAARGYGFDAEQVVALGYSNGANIAFASLLQHPEAYAGAILLRPIMPFDMPPTADLSGKRVLTLLGERDRYLPHGRAVPEHLARLGATVTTVQLPVGHGLTSHDADAIHAWWDEDQDNQAAPEETR